MTTPDSSMSKPSAHAPQSSRHATTWPAGSADSLPVSERSRHPSLSEHAAALTSALAVFAEQMAGMEWGAEHLQCSETEAICDVLILSGHVESANTLRDFHAQGDNEGYEQHHARYHELTETEPGECCLPDPSDDQINRMKEG
jgi:hypothetical protein